MPRRRPRPAATRDVRLAPQREACWICSARLRAAYTTRRTVTTLSDTCELRLTVRRCETPSCPRYWRSYRPEAEGAWALPHAEFGLDVIAFVGTLRFGEHRSVPEIHR